MHVSGGEVVGGTTKCSEDLLLSMVLSFIAPFRTQSMNGNREGVPGVKETKTAEETNHSCYLPLLIYDHGETSNSSKLSCVHEEMASCHGNSKQERHGSQHGVNQHCCHGNSIPEDCFW